MVRAECLKAAQAVGLAGYLGHSCLRGHRKQHISLDVCSWQEACSSRNTSQKRWESAASTMRPARSQAQATCSPNVQSLETTNTLSGKLQSICLTGTIRAALVWAVFASVHCIEVGQAKPWVMKIADYHFLPCRMKADMLRWRNLVMQLRNSG